MGLAGLIMGGGGGLAAGIGGATSASGFGSAALSGFAGSLGASIPGLGGYGLDALATSKAHDRAKNMATRKYLYERIALKSANINEGYMFANPRGVQTPQTPQQPGAKIQGGDFTRAAALPAQIDVARAQAQGLRARAVADLAAASKTRAETPFVGAQPKLFDVQRKDIQLKLDEYAKNPDLLKNELMQRGTPNNFVSAAIQGLTDIITTLRTGEGSDRTIASTILYGAGGLFGLAKFKQAISAGNYTRAAQIGFDHIKKSALKGAARAKWLRAFSNPYVMAGMGLLMMLEEAEPPPDPETGNPPQAPGAKRPGRSRNRANQPR